MKSVFRKGLRKVLKPVLHPLLRHLTKDLSDEDVWKREPADLSFRDFGQGSLHEWSWYFEGHSTVKASSAKEIVEWLRGCRYVGDRVLFNEKDFWQHPVTFEHLQEGDCEDHALWAWRKLKEIGVPAEFVCGLRGPLTSKGNRGHAWVQLELNGIPHLMETVANRRKPMTRLLTEVRREYCPAYSVDTDFRTYRYGGFAEFVRAQLEIEASSKP